MSNGESYYSFYQNVSQVNGFKGMVGYSIRELNTNEFRFYCSSSVSLNSRTYPTSQNQSNFTNDFMVRSYSSGCYYFDSSTGKWSSDGMDIYGDTNLKQTRCKSNHLTSFAGGLVLLPSIINFQYVFANASIDLNLTIYITIMLFFFMYIFFAIISIILDKMDKTKFKIIQLKDNNPVDNYFYEIIVFTGNRSEAGTQSKVNCLF